MYTVTLGYYPQSCSSLCKHKYVEVQFFVKSNEACPTEYSGAAPPVKQMMTPKVACKAKVI